MNATDENTPPPGNDQNPASFITQEHPRKEQRLSVLVLALYLVTAIFYLWPLPLHFSTAIPGDNGDSYLNFWPFWYYPRALLSGESLFYHQLQLYPHGMPMVYMTASPIGSILMSPISQLISPAAALNTWLILHLWLGGWFFYKFARLLRCAPGASWLGGFAWQWSPFIAAHITGHYTLAQVAYTAAAFYFLLLLIHRLLPQKTPWRRLFAPIAGLGIACWALAATDFYLTMMTAFLLPVLLLYATLDPALRPVLKLKKFWAAIACAIIISAVLIIPWISELLHVRAQHDYTAPDPRLVAHNTMRWRQLSSPPQYHFLWGPHIYGRYEIAVSTYNEYTYLGIVGFIVAATGLLLVRPLTKVALIITVFLLLLGLGSGNSHSNPTAPGFSLSAIGYLWPTSFPFSEFRVPGRWHFALCALLAIALAQGADALIRRRFPRPRASAAFVIVLTAIMAFDLNRWPFPICPATPIATGISPHKSGTVLDIPTGIQSGQGHQMGIIDNHTLRRQLDHSRPLIYGNVARLPNDVYNQLLADLELQTFFQAQNPYPSNHPAPTSEPNWPEFRKRYNITAARIPLDWPTSASLKQIIDATAPNNWQWHEANQALIGELP